MKEQDALEGFDWRRVSESELTSDERQALAKLGISNSASAVHKIVDKANLFMLRHPERFNLSAADISDMKREFLQASGRKVSFWPEDPLSLKGAAVTLLTLGFNIAVNSVKENIYLRESLARRRETEAESNAARQKLARFFPKTTP